MNKSLIIVVLALAAQSMHAASMEGSKAAAASAATSSAASAAATASSLKFLERQNNTHMLMKDIARSHFKYAQNVTDFRPYDGINGLCRTAAIVLGWGGFGFVSEAVKELKSKPVEATTCDGTTCRKLIDINKAYNLHPFQCIKCKSSHSLTSCCECPCDGKAGSFHRSKNCRWKGQTMRVLLDELIEDDQRFSEIITAQEKTKRAAARIA